MDTVARNRFHHDSIALLCHTEACFPALSDDDRHSGWASISSAGPGQEVKQPENGIQLSSGISN